MSAKSLTGAMWNKMSALSKILIPLKDSFSKKITDFKSKIDKYRPGYKLPDKEGYIKPKPECYFYECEEYEQPLQSALLVLQLLIYFILEPFYILAAIFRINKEGIKTGAKNFIYNIFYIFINLVNLFYCIINLAINAYNEGAEKIYDAMNGNASMKWVLLATTVLSTALFLFGYFGLVSINMPSALIACCAFFIMTIISFFRKSYFNKNLTPPQQFTFILLSAASAITAFGLESSHIYFFNPYTVTIAILMPSIILFFYCMICKLSENKYLSSLCSSLPSLSSVPSLLSSCFFTSNKFDYSVDNDSSIETDNDGKEGYQFLP